MTKAPWELTRDMFLSETEVDRLLAFLRQRMKSATAAEKAEAATDEVIIQSLIFSGLRNTEFCRLELKDTIVGTGRSIFEVRASRGEDRTVHVPRTLSSLIRRYADEIRPLIISESIDDEDLAQPLVLNERGRPYERTALYRRVVRILTAAGFGERASVQLLRHTYGVLGYKRSGGNLLFLQRQLGHVHPMVTSIYAEFVDEDYGQLADIVGGKRRSRN
jgi:site-specific recombinase XerD